MSTLDGIAAGNGRVVITGGAGFIGSNLADRLAGLGRHVVLLDNLSRPCVAHNVDWLRSTHGNRVELIVGDVRDPAPVRAAMEGADHVFHLAAQVAVTTSVADPAGDFDVNARGTLNVLEAARSSSRRPTVLFTSTNKVYGALGDVALTEEGHRYQPRDARLRERGISEARALDFHSPYGCSKGAADQYVLDYARTFGLRAAVFRMSCIYGPRQFGNEDQGWVAHFMMRAAAGEPITIYGDGLQVRDVLFVEDLVEALVLATSQIETVRGRAFNMGGGPGNTLALLELCQRISTLCAREPELHFLPWRLGDQRYFVADVRRFSAATGWAPRVDVTEGLQRLWRWVDSLRASNGGAFALDDAPTPVDEVELYPAARRLETGS